MPHRPHLYRVMLLSLCWVLSSFALAQQPSNTQQPSPSSQNPASPEQATPGTESKANAVTKMPRQQEGSSGKRRPSTTTWSSKADDSHSDARQDRKRQYLYPQRKDCRCGQSVNAPAGATVIDASGKFVMPGLIDSHSHIALDDDVNEPTSRSHAHDDARRL